MDVTVYPSRNDIPTAGGGKTALCLCGGGISGALFEAGVLAALDDVLERPASTGFDIYIGASAGASVGSIVGQGVPAERLFRALRDPADSFFPLRREDVYRVELSAWLKAGARLVAGAASTLVAHLRHHEDQLVDDLASLHDLLPAGIFRLDRYASFLRNFYAREGLAQCFVDLRRELYVVANDVDSAERAVFGDGKLRDIEIALAVAASSAIPMFFEPVRIADRDYIDGGLGRVAHIDVAIDHGADRILIVNPVVPVRNIDGKACLPSARGHCARMRDKGLLYLGNQALRIANRARLHFGIKRYLAEAPHVEVLLIEPSDADTLLFVNSSMGLRARREILDYARERASGALKETFSRTPSVAQIGMRKSGPTPIVSA